MTVNVKDKDSKSIAASTASSRLSIWFCWLASLSTAAAASYVFLVAIATESLRFGKCGPSSLSATDSYCRIGIKFFYTSCAFGLVSVMFAVLAIWLWRRRAKKSNR